jgi:uncharacterized protein (TIGR00730 family)
LAVEDFTAGATHDQPARRQSSIDPPFDERVRQLVADWGAEKSPELIEEMIITALKMARDKMGTGDLKLIDRSLKEMRLAAKVFSEYRQFRKVCVFGSARVLPSEAQYQVAEEFAREMVRQDFMVITGGGDGIMGAAQAGAGREHSFGLNIRLPFEQQANATIQGDRKLIDFNYFFTRKLNFVKETHAFALFPGGLGTMDETFEVLTLMQTGKARIIPIVLLDRPGGAYWQTWVEFLKEHLFKFGYIGAEDFHFFKIVPNVQEAVAEIVGFYRVYQSSRWVGEQLVIRLARKLSAKSIADLNREFADVLQSGEIVQGKALRVEKNEPKIWDLPRLILTPNRRSFGRFRQLIDAINASELA